MNPGFVQGDRLLVSFRRGSRVRLLVACPEIELDVGALGTVTLVHWGDDIELWVAFDAGPDHIRFDVNELWWIEPIGELQR